MTFIVDRLQSSDGDVQAAPLDGPFYPVVSVRASRRGAAFSHGIGFFLSEWPSCLVTARHVIMGGDGSSPDAIDILAWDGTAEVPIVAARFAFYSLDDEQHPDVDVAVVRIHGRFPNSYRKASLSQESTQVKVLSYEDGEDFVTQGWLDEPWLRLSNLGAHGMSGAPVLLVRNDGREPDEVVGVYHGENDTPGDVAKAYAIGTRAVMDFMRALAGA